MDITIILLIVNVFAAVAVIGLTLIQQPKGDMGSAFGGGGSQSMFGSRGSANFLTKSTSWMCFVFFASSLTLAYMYAQGNSEDGVVDQSVVQEVEQASELPSIVEATSSDTDGSSDLPSIPVDEAAEAVNQAVENGAEVLEQAADAVDGAVNDARDAATDAVDSVEGAVEEPTE